VTQALQATTAKDWSAFERKYRSEMKAPDRARELDVLAALSQGTNFSVGCYCEDPARCHRSILATLLEEHGGKVVRAG
jgi:uncharacterized protein YeaO (DUF488 family)